MKKKILTLFTLLFAFFTYAQSISLTTTSNSGSWSPSEVRNYYGATLRWQASNSKIGTLIQDVDDPNFDFSANDGTPIEITISSADGLAKLTRLYVFSLEIIYFDVSKAANLQEFSFSRNKYNSTPDFSLNGNLTKLFGFVNDFKSIDISHNPNLETIYLFGLPITDLNIDHNPKLKYVSIWNNQFTPEVFDYIVKKLDEFGIEEGYLYIRDNRTVMSKLTQASSYAFKNLKIKGWLIDIPQINIVGSGVSIPGDGSNTPSPMDGTDFGTVALNGPVIKKTYTIENTAFHNSLVLTDPSPYIIISGDSDFSLSVMPNSVIAGASDRPSIPGTTTFEITYNPKTLGERSATVSVKSNDPYLSSYTFNIKARANEVKGPVMNITGNNAVIPHGTTTTNVTDGTDFGEVVINGNAIQTFFIKNIGDEPLIVNPITSLGIPFNVDIQPSSPILPGNSTTVKITYSPTRVDTHNAQVTIYSNDLTNPLFPGSTTGLYSFFISGKCVDPPPVQDIMITQYYEGSTESKWIEVVNRSSATIPAGEYYLALYDQGEIPLIQTQAPTRFEQIPQLTSGQVALFSNLGVTFPILGNIGIPMVDVIESTACDFDGNDIILISTTVDSNCYANRVDMMGNLSVNQWGVDTSFIRGGFSRELPERDFNLNSWTPLSIEGEVNTADTGTNIALGTQILGPSIWDGTQWTGLKPDRTRNVEINGPYNANYGSIIACNLTVNDVLNFDAGTTNYIMVSNNLFIKNTFTIGDEESLLTLNPLANIEGEIIKNEKSTPLNNLHDVTYWSSPVENETIGHVFDGVDPNRIFYLNPALVNPLYVGSIYGHWFIAEGSSIMTPGRGYSAEGTGTGEQFVTFSGKPNNGDLTLTVNYKGSPDADSENDNFNLVGNPYPSALAIDPLLLDSQNNNLEKTIYLWSHNTPVSGGGDFVGADYATYTAQIGGVAAGSGGAIPNGYLASGQGFMVRTENTGNGLINFENDDRVIDKIPLFFKSENRKKEVTIEKDRLWISLKTNQGGYKQILLGFMDGAADYKDAFDGLHLKSNNPISLYSVIGNEKFAIQGFGPFSPEKKVELGFDTDVAPRRFTVGIDQKEGVFKNKEVYLTDNLLGITHNLSQSAYSFEQTISGEFANRFTLQFANNSLDVEEILQESGFSVFNSGEGFGIHAEKVVKEMKVYDMLGRTIISSKPNQQNFYLNSNNLKTGTVLIFEVKLENGVSLNKKVIKL